MRGNEITSISPAGQEIKASFRIESSKSPKQIDITFLNGPHKGETCPGLFQRNDVDEHVPWLCMVDPGSRTARPTNFSYEREQGRSLISPDRLNPEPNPDSR